MNRFEIDDQWQSRVRERLLTPVLREYAFQGQVYFFGVGSQIAKLLQMRAHVDAIIPLSNGGDLSLELKMVRWPGALEGRPSHRHWPYFFLETWSCSIPGHERQGWMITCQADFLLWCQCSLRENELVCFPLYLPRLRRWFVKHQATLQERKVPNPINGRFLWSVGKLAPIDKVCRDLKVEPFRVDENGLVSDLLGKPIIGFLRGDAA